MSSNIMSKQVSYYVLNRMTTSYAPTPMPYAYAPGRGVGRK